MIEAPQCEAWNMMTRLSRLVIGLASQSTGGSPIWPSK